MAKRLSQIYGVSPQSLESEGVFDSFVDIDSPLYVDPFLLESTSANELHNSKKRFDNYFKQVVSIIKADPSGKTGRLRREVVRMLTFPESSLTFLGYAKGGRPGSGIGPKTAKRLTDTSYAIVSSGFDNPVLFELLGLFENGVGADQISDMTIAIILEDLCGFSQRVAKNLSLDTSLVVINDKRFQCPLNPITGKAVIFFPKDILRDLPVAQDWSDIDRICMHNEEVRRKVNQLVGETYKAATQASKNIPLSEKKKRLRKAVISHPEVMRDLARCYGRKKSKPYDFETDRAGVHKWANFGPMYLQLFGSSIKRTKIKTEQDALAAVVEMVEKFKNHCETKGIWKNFYHPVKGQADKLHGEPFMQRAFYSLALVLCEANGLAVSPETDGGSGPVDFKFSLGNPIKVLVEIKKSSSNSVLRNYENQMNAYKKANDTEMSIFVLMRVSDSTTVIDNIRKIEAEGLRKGLTPPKLIVIDIRRQESASKR